jgi:hypothetical protein
MVTCFIMPVVLVLLAAVVDLPLVGAALLVPVAFPDVVVAVRLVLLFLATPTESWYVAIANNATKQNTINLNPESIIPPPQNYKNSAQIVSLYPGLILVVIINRSNILKKLQFCIDLGPKRVFLNCLI